MSRSVGQDLVNRVEAQARRSGDGWLLLPLHSPLCERTLVVARGRGRGGLASLSALLAAGGRLGLGLDARWSLHGLAVVLGSVATAFGGNIDLDDRFGDSALASTSWGGSRGGGGRSDWSALLRRSALAVVDVGWVLVVGLHEWFGLVVDLT